MVTKLDIKNYSILFLTLILVTISGVINHYTSRPNIIISKQDSAFNINKELISIVFASQKMLIADTYWIATLLESDLKHYKDRDLNSWMYHRFDTITHLDPWFYKAYLFGGQYLDIVKDDLEGAKYIYKKGLKKYPDDYQLLFNAGFLFAIELKDYDFAIPIYEKLIKNPQAPKYFVTLLHKMKYENKDLTLEDTYKSLSSLFETLDESTFLYSKVKADLYRIKAELDTNCLNANGSGCSKFDFNGDPYFLKDGIWTSKEKITPYGIYKKN